MPIFCNGSSKATITVNVLGSTFQIISNNPPANVDLVSEKNNADTTIYSHAMTSRMNQAFPRNIIDVELVNPSNQFIYSLKDSRGIGNPPIDLYAPCPTTSLSSRTDKINIDGKRIYSNFDEFNDPDPYNNNSGVCTYRVFFNSYRLVVSDNSGTIYNNSFPEEPAYTVACDDECPKGYLKLNSPNYPGYCCIPCSEVIGGIKSITAAVRGINRG